MAAYFVFGGSKTSFPSAQGTDLLIAVGQNVPAGQYCLCKPQARARWKCEDTRKGLHH